MAKVFLIRSNEKGLAKGSPRRILEETGWVKRLRPGDLAAIKLHFGEVGNKGQVAPEYIAKMVEASKARNAKPFLAETSTLYVGKRSNACDHILLAHAQGYTLEAVGAPIILADGLRGQARSKVKIPGKHFSEIEVASDCRVYDAMIVVTHVTGHPGAGLGGTIKNLGMGLASRAGKRKQHSAMKPEVTAKKCIACNRCSEWCPENAIGVAKGEKAAQVDHEKCIGCGECLAVCPENAVRYDWGADVVGFHEKMAEYALGVVKGWESKVVYLSFLTNITRSCDCLGSENEVRCKDIGVIGSTDPVAVDQAALDLVKQEHGSDLFAEFYPGIDYAMQLEHAQAIGMGSREYELKELQL